MSAKPQVTVTFARATYTLVDGRLSAEHETIVLGTFAAEHICLILAALVGRTDVRQVWTTEVAP